ncbi:MAG TPA: nucleoside recognition domain-containing protein [Acidobacteriota bacterium]|nr:nucleoside recognition domain-containing protein [Acidobacteriota bacterium]
MTDSDHRETVAALQNDVSRLADKSNGDRMVTALYGRAEQIASRTVRQDAAAPSGRLTDWIDRLTTSRILGLGSMLAVLAIILWVTIAGANVPSALLATGLFWIESQLTLLFQAVGAPDWLHGFLVLGVYRGLAWVVAVMLPPMAIFFPLFTLLEDLGYLPRVAFNLDRLFQKAGTHGKQALTMAMGFGCNAAGVIACRIIDSPRERTLAIITNNFMPCNGRWPTLITMATLFVGGAVVAAQTTIAAAALAALVLFGVFVTLTVSWVLSKTVLRGLPSEFTLELPPFRRPAIGRILVRALIDRTLTVLWRAVIVAAPVGGITWLLARITIGDKALLYHASDALDGFGRALGLDGIILMAFILGLPANEIVMPIMIMAYVGAGAMLQLDSLSALKTLLVDQNGWTWLTAVCVMLFSLLHYPCGTAMLTIYRETKSVKWTLLSIFLPLGIAIGVCFAVAQTVRALGLV